MSNIRYIHKDTQETFVNVNDLIIVIMKLLNNCTSKQERAAFQKLITTLTSIRDNKN